MDLKNLLNSFHLVEVFKFIYFAMHGTISQEGEAHGAFHLRDDNEKK